MESPTQFKSASIKQLGICYHMVSYDCAFVGAAPLLNVTESTLQVHVAQLIRNNRRQLATDIFDIKKSLIWSMNPAVRRLSTPQPQTPSDRVLVFILRRGSESISVERRGEPLQLS